MAGKERLLAGIGVAIIVTTVVVVMVFQMLKPSPQNGGGEGDIVNPTVPAGKMAAPFALHDMNGRLVTLADLRGKVVFLNIWATWCGPCREEMPSIETLYDDFKSDKNFVILAVSQDTQGLAAVEPYVEKNGYHFEVLLDPQNKVGEAYDVGGVPETFIIDRDGRIVAHHMGAFDWSSSDFRAALKALLNQKEKISS
ncbi:MAG TPA: TlpA disulfide reductase family protein [Candidatus Binataceae bacterium]|nr:TlpA disulfide reductase family protein [Candidatus Binataceae bacterium]